MLVDFVKQTASIFASIDHKTARRVGGLLQSVDCSGQEIIARDNQPIALSSLGKLHGPKNHTLTKSAIKLAPFLSWTNARLSHNQPTSFVGDYCFTEIIGPDGVVPHTQFRFGAYLQIPNTFYPSHKHEAEELYFPLAGEAFWQRGENEFALVESGNLIHHPSYIPHATHTVEKPMLALWAWVGNLSKQTYEFVRDPL